VRLNDVYAVSVPRTQRRRVGRGWGSGIGKTSGRGEKGAGRRSGTRFRLRFEGGQMPLYRRLPKKGFSNHAFRVRYLGVNVGELDRAFEAGAVVDLDALRAAHLAPKTAALWKVLGDGKLSKSLTVKAHAASGGAKSKVEGAGGTLELLPGAHRERAEALAERRKKLATSSTASVEASRAEAKKANEARAAAPKKGEKGAKPAKGEKPAGGKPAGAKAEGGKPQGGKPEGGKAEGKPEGGKGKGGGAPKGQA
jgi:large subunit ribosomal protein L15